MANKTNRLVSVYRTRFGEPLTTAEAYGYWLFVAGTALAVAGMALFLVSMGSGRTGMRELAYLLAGSGLAAALAGQVIGQSFHRGARRLVYLGLVVALAALVWFLSVFPGGWALTSGSAQGVVAVYTLGVALITLSGVVAPLSVGQSRARASVESALVDARSDDAADAERIAELEAELDAARAETDEARGELDDARAGTADVRDERDAARVETDNVRDDLHAAAAQVKQLYESSATFDVYRDKAGKWRWRLVHKNGNIVATSGESYASDRNARRGMRSVKRNALGAATVWQREADPEPLVDPVASDPQASFELYRDDSDEYRWRLRHDNGNTIAAATRGFSDKRAAREGVESVQASIAPAEYLTFDPAGIEVYGDEGGDYRWRLVHRNGNILADSAEGYSSRSNARRAADRFQEVAGGEVGDSSQFETYEDAAGEHRWRLIHRNGNILADSGEGYSSASERDEGVDRVRQYAPDANRLTVGVATVEVYEDEGGDFRWRLRHRNGTILATSGEGYSGRSNAVEAINGVKRHAPNAPVTE
ncbi:MAG: DUF1508 domain-containing protein [Halobacteriales archaeon]|nr:DUF1508 domain-containing protein [Halobacteriales archaeon]